MPGYYFGFFEVYVKEWAVFSSLVFISLSLSLKVLRQRGLRGELFAAHSQEIKFQTFV